jgi:hypothetical protein
MSDSPRTIEELHGTDLWDTIEEQVSRWRESCDDEEGRDLLAFLQGEQVARFLSVMYEQQWAFVQQKPIMDCLDDIHTMEALVANLSNTSAQKTERLVEIHRLSRPHFKEESA